MTSKHNNHINEQELIRKYLEDSLTQEEELVVADLYDSDKEFREALDGLEMLSSEDFTETLHSVNARIDHKIQSSANVHNITMSTTRKDNVRQLFAAGSSMRRLAIAASLVLFLLFGGTLFMNQWQSPNQRAYAANFSAKPYPDQITRGHGDALSQPEKLAISAYNTENYEVSVQYFEDLFRQYPDNEKYGLFLGISHMGRKEHGKAIAIFEDLQANAVKYPEDIDWYLSLSYIKTQEIAKAKELLALLAENDTSYYQEASQDLLKKLK